MQIQHEKKALAEIVRINVKTEMTITYTIPLRMTRQQQRFELKKERLDKMLKNKSHLSHAAHDKTRKSPSRMKCEFV